MPEAVRSSLLLHARDDVFETSISMAQHDFETVIQTLDRLTAQEQLACLERLARILQAQQPQQRNPDQQRAALQRLRRDLATLPVRNPAEGVSNRQHDQRLSGAP